MHTIIGSKRSIWHSQHGIQTLDNNGTDRDCDAGFSDILSHEKPTEHAAYSYKKTIDQRSKTTFCIRVANKTHIIITYMPIPYGKWVHSTYFTTIVIRSM
jgi:hypothetical protein